MFSISENLILTVKQPTATHVDNYFEHEFTITELITPTNDSIQRLVMEGGRGKAFDEGTYIYEVQKIRSTNRFVQ